MKTLIFKQLSSLEKVFLDEDYEKQEEVYGTIALGGERVSYQLLYMSTYDKQTVKVSALADERLQIVLRDVNNVPCEMAANRQNTDEFYLRKAPGLYPDLLTPNSGSIDVNNELCKSLFVTCIIPEDMPAAVYPVELILNNGKEEIKKVFNIDVLPENLTQQEITCTEWFHADCIASYYKYDIFSEPHWRMIEKFIEKASYIGVNMILTPVFTPPLDTEVGGERPTVQLVSVRRRNNVYSFDFEKLKRWIDICRKHGINKFEISHLFTQWGTGKTPKIIAETENGIEKIFGWHMEATSCEYKEFLERFLPELIKFLKNEDVYENTFFHVSDEPDYKRDREIYEKEHALVSAFVEKDKIMDAMSHYEFCRDGLAKTPVVVNYTVDDFLKNGIDVNWTYYCCMPANGGYCNRFISMPSGRNRILGFQMFKYGINGFLHWGYNFYYSQLSKREINPFMTTETGGAFPAGDAFLVYPGEDGPLESLRSVVFYEANQDNRACKILESYIGKNAVEEILDRQTALTMSNYPRTNSGVLRIRDEINKKLKEALG